MKITLLALPATMPEERTGPVSQDESQTQTFSETFQLLTLVQSLFVLFNCWKIREFNTYAYISRINQGMLFNGHIAFINNFVVSLASY